MKVVILNTHSLLNAGDAAIVAAEIALVRHVLGEVEFVITSRTPGVDREFYRQLHAEVAPPLLPAPSLFPSLGEKVSGSVGNLLALHAKRRLVHALKRADLVLSSGGGYFFSNRRVLPGPMFWQAYAHVRLAQRLGTPVLFAPQSFGPFANRMARRALWRLLSHSSVTRVLAREQESLALLHSLCGREVVAGRFALSPDLAFAFEVDCGRAVATAHTSPRPLLGVTVREWAFPECRSRADRDARRTTYLEGLVAACRWFHASHGGSILVIPHSRGPGRFEDDRIVSRELVCRLAETLPGACISLANLAEDASPASLVQLVASVDVLLATRFHSAVFACLAGRPFVAIAYQPKTTGIMAMLGLDEFSVPISDATGERLTPLLEILLRQGPSIVAERIRPAVARLRGEVARAMRDALAASIAGPLP